MNDRLMRIARIAYGHCGMCGQNSKDQDLLMEDLEQRIDAAVEAVRDAVAILEDAGMARDAAALKLVALVKSELEEGEGEGIKGGLGDGQPDIAFDPDELKAGVLVELEHTNDPELAEEIAKDHLRELPDYYTRLKKMEEGGEKAMEQDADDPSDIEERKRRAANVVHDAIMSIMKSKDLIGRAMHEVMVIERADPQHRDMMGDFDSIRRQLEEPKDRLAAYYEELYPFEGESESGSKAEGLASEAAEYQGKKVKINDPVRNPAGSKKKFHVFVKDPKTGKVRKVQFGDPKLEIKRDDPERRKSFRARHKCDSEAAKDKTKAKYWSCYQWRKGKKVDN